MKQPIAHQVTQAYRVKGLAISGVLLVVVLLISGCGASTGAAAFAQGGTATATISIPARDATRQAASEAFQHEMETAAARPSSTSLPAFTPYPTPEPVQLEPGIYEDSETARMVMTVRNCWADLFDNQIIGARAGAFLDEPSQGVLAVVTWNLNMTESSGHEYYETPVPGGAVRIVQANLPYLTVQTDDSTLFVFNITTRQWESSQPTATPTATPPASSSGTVTFAADADARVEQEEPTDNYGTSGTLRIEASDPGDDAAIESYLRFTVAGLQGPVQQAKLRLYATTNGTSVGSEVYGVTGTWTETGITWNTRPSRGSTPLATSGGVSAGSWVEYDVTSLVTGNGSVSFALVAPSDDGVSFSSREGATLPELVITAAAASLPNPRSFVAEADARVESGSATTNYGTSNILKVDSSPAIESYLRFTVTGVSGSVQSAKLRLYVGSNGTNNGPAVYTADTSWAETALTWNTRPTLGGTIVANVGATGTNGWVEYDVTAVVTGDGSYSFALVGESSDDVTFESRQGNNRPQLLLTLTP